MNGPSSAIRTLRDARGWSQANLAAQAGVGRKSIVMLERGYIPQWGGALERVADALGVEVTELKEETMTAVASTPEAIEVLKGLRVGQAGRLVFDPGSAPLTGLMQTFTNASDVTHWRSERGGPVVAGGSVLSLSLASFRLQLEIYLPGQRREQRLTFTPPPGELAAIGQPATDRWLDDQIRCVRETPAYGSSETLLLVDPSALSGEDSKARQRLEQFAEERGIAVALLSVCGGVWPARVTDAWGLPDEIGSHPESNEAA